MVARHQKESRQVQARSGNETYYRYLDTDSERLVTSAIDCATGQLSGAATAEPYPNSIMDKFIAIAMAPHVVAQIGLHPCLQPQTQANPALVTDPLFAVSTI